MIARHHKIPTLGANDAKCDGQTEGWKNNVALAYPYHVGKSCNKLGSIPPSGLGDSMKGRWRKNNVAVTHPYHAGKSCSKFG